MTSSIPCSRRSWCTTASIADAVRQGYRRRHRGARGVISSTTPSTSAASRRPASASPPRPSARIGACPSPTASAIPLRPRWRHRPAPATAPSRAVVDRFDALALALGGTPDDTDAPGSSGADARRPGTLRGRRASGSSAACSRCWDRGWRPRRCPRRRCMFDVYSQQHAWHAELFAERLPALDRWTPPPLRWRRAPRWSAALGAGGGRPASGDRRRQRRRPRRGGSPVGGRRAERCCASSA